MAVNITGIEEVALYDSVTGIAFGEVFQGIEAAQSFLTWLAEIDGRDARTITPQELAVLRDAWTIEPIVLPMSDEADAS